MRFFEVNLFLKNLIEKYVRCFVIRCREMFDVIRLPIAVSSKSDLTVADTRKNNKKSIGKHIS